MSLNRSAAILTAIITLLSFSKAMEKPSGGWITGSVVDQRTKTPIPSANVVVLGSQMGAVTDENGSFTIRNVPAGEYQIHVSVLGYRQAAATIKVGVIREPSKHDFVLDEEDITLQGVEVQAAHFAPVPDAPVSLRSFSNAELQNSAGGLDDVVRAVRILPGVAQPKADRTDLIVRGGAPSENLVLIDNIEVPYINHFSTQGAGGGSVSIVDIDLVRNSSFSTGGFGVRYGDKLSSVLNIGLRDGLEDRFHSKVSIAATQLGFEAEGPLTKKGSYLFSVRKSYLDLVFKMYGFGFAPQYWDFLGKVSYLVGAGDKITMLAVGSSDRMDLFNDTQEHRYQNSEMLFSNQDHLVAAATWHHFSTDAYSTVTVRNVQSTLEFSQYTPDLAPRFQSSSIESETSVRGDLVVQIDATSDLAVGAEARSVNVRSAIDSKWGGPVVLNRSLNGMPGKAAAYGQFSGAIGSLKVTLGLRGDYCSLISEQLVVAPRFSSVLMLSPTTDVALSIGKYYQAPSYIWLAGNPANSDLSHLGVDQIVIGFHHVLAEDLGLSVEGYLKRYSNYPTSLTRPFLIMANTGAQGGGLGEATASFGLDPLVSSGSGYSRGIELSMQKKLSGIPCYGVFSATFSETRYQALDGVSRPSDFDQRLILNVGGGYLFGMNWEVSGKFLLYTGRPYTPFDAQGTSIVDESNAARVGLNHQLDGRIMRRWTMVSVTVETYLDVQNLYNRRPVDAPVFSDLHQKAEQAPALGIVPTIGLTVRF